MKVKNAAGEEKEVEFMWAGFGNRGGSLVADVAAQLCDPERADADLTNSEQLKGKIAVVKRGATSFVDKAQRAEKAGSIAVIIVNSDDTLVKAGGDDSKSNVGVPVVLVRSDAAASLLAADTSISFSTAATSQNESNLSSSADNR